jgi:hypothetical protein
MKAVTRFTDPPPDRRATTSSSKEDVAPGTKRDVNSRRPRALVADDDVLTLHMVAAAVEKFGADVTCASTGGELIEHLGPDEPFDLIVTISTPRFGSCSDRIVSPVRSSTHVVRAHRRETGTNALVRAGIEE